MSRFFLPAALILLFLASPALAAEKTPDSKPAEAGAASPADVVAPATPAATTAATPATAAVPEAASAARKWDAVADKSEIAFHGKQMGTDFDGVIRKFTADINFDADHLDQSKAVAILDIASIDAKDAERNKNVQGADWFETAKFPTARFETTKFTKTGDNTFTADGNLTIRGVSVPVQLPFTLAFSAGDSGKDQVVMTGKVTLDRSKFQLGQGDWKDPSVIANEVPVDVKLTATAPKESAKDKAAEKSPAPAAKP